MKMELEVVVENEVIIEEEEVKEVEKEVMELNEEDK